MLLGLDEVGRFTSPNEVLEFDITFEVFVLCEPFNIDFAVFFFDQPPPAG